MPEYKSRVERKKAEKAEREYVKQVEKQARKEK